jgi:hypothetical protein
MRAVFLSSFVAVLGLLPASASAQATIDDLYVDFAVPDVAGLGVLGVNPSSVSKPGNLKELSLSVLSISDSIGPVRPGVAFQWAPVFTFESSVQNYRDSIWRPVAVSGATVKRAGGGTEIGLGVRYMLVDRTDPLMSTAFQTTIDGLLGQLSASATANQKFLTKARDVLLEVLAPVADKLTQLKALDALLAGWDIHLPPTPQTAAAQEARFDRQLQAVTKSLSLTLPPLSAPLRQKIQDLAREYEAISLREGLPEALFEQRTRAALIKAKNQFRDDTWNATVVHVDAAAIFASPDATWGDLRTDRFGGLAGGGLPLGRSAQVVFQAVGRKGVADAPTERWFYSLGGRLLAGSATRRVSFDVLYSDARSTSADANGSRTRFTAGTEVRLSEGFWLEVSFGGESRPQTGTDKRTSLLTLAGLKYAFKSAPRFTQIPGHGDEN